MLQILFISVLHMIYWLDTGMKSNRILKMAASIKQFLYHQTLISYLYFHPILMKFAWLSRDLASSLTLLFPLILKAPITTTAGNTSKYFFRENKTRFHVN